MKKFFYGLLFLPFVLALSLELQANISLTDPVYLEQRSLLFENFRTPSASSLHETVEQQLPSVDFEQCLREVYPGRSYTTHNVTTFSTLYVQHTNPESVKNLSYKIPKIIHQVWVGPRSREKYEKLRQTWIEKHPDWFYKLWTDEDVKKLKLVNQDAYDHAGSYAEKADILRYELVYLFGGVYVDIDFLCIKPLNILNRAYSFYAGMVDTELLANGLIGATPGHPILKHCIENLNTDPRGFPYTSGPTQLTKSFIALAPHCLDPIVALPPNYFYPLHKKGFGLSDEEIHGCVKPETFAVHYWAADWGLLPSRK